LTSSFAPRSRSSSSVALPSPVSPGSCVGRGWRRCSRTMSARQDPMTSLNPTLTIATQIMETMQRHLDLSRDEARKRAIGLLEEVHIPSARQRLDDYPHRYSGGMRQRVMIAIALSCNPKLLIADEPTTALDVTVQAGILDLLDELREQHQMSMIIITHDMGVVAEAADDIAVMYAGQ